jgi:energy-coupling factor transport system permease protein
MPLLTEEWQQLTLARRARGIDAGWNPLARFQLAASTAFALLVGAIRRGTRLATAMEARGFDSGAARTSARTAHFGPADALVIAGGAAMAAISLLAGVR